MNNLKYGLWLKYSIVIVSVLVLLGVVIYVQRSDAPTEATEVSMADEAVGEEDQADDTSSSSKEEKTDETPKTTTSPAPELSSNREPVSPVVTKPVQQLAQNTTTESEKESIKSDEDNKEQKEESSSATESQSAPEEESTQKDNTTQNAENGQPQNIIAYFTKQKNAQQKIATASKATQAIVPNYIAQGNVGQRNMEAPRRAIVPQPVYNAPAAPVQYNGPSASVQYTDYPTISNCDVCADNCCQECCSCCPAWTSPRRFTISHTEGRWLDNHIGYTSFGIFSKIWGDACCRPMFFADLRGHVFNDGKGAGNFGGGVRYQFCNSIFGVNAYYDIREACFEHVYNQVGVGLEMLNPCFDVRVNMYFPVGQHDGHGRRHFFDNFVGGFKADCREHRKSVGGADFEVGRWLCCKGPCDFFDLYVAAGAYYFDRHQHDDVAIGGKVRAVSHLGRYLTVELRAGYDPVYRGEIQGVVGVSIPLDCLCNMFRRGCCDNYSTGGCDDCCLIYQPVVRQEIIALDKKRCCWHWNWPSSGCKCDGNR